MVILLFAVRGMFTREVLYSPGFAAAFGLAIGLAMIEGVWVRRVSPVRRTPAWAGSAPQPVPDPVPVGPPGLSEGPVPVPFPKVRPFTRGPTNE
jgi:hypothetical protein